MESGKLLPGVRTGNIFLFVQRLKILSPGERHHRGPRDPGPVRGQQPRGDLGGGRHRAACLLFLQYAILRLSACLVL